MKFKPTWHLLHAFLTILTGVWVVVWIVKGLMNSAHNAKMNMEIQQNILKELKNINKGE